MTRAVKLILIVETTKAICWALFFDKGIGGCKNADG